MICPKCGFEQPESLECIRCGVIISRYKGPAAGATPPQPIAVPPPLPLSGNETVRISLPSPPPPPTQSAAGTVYGGPDPAASPSGIQGTVYGGPVPAPAGGGTVYGGPPAAGAAASPVLWDAGAARASFGIGSVVGQAFSVYFSNFMPFALLTAIILSPLFVLQGYTSSLKVVPGSPAALVPTLLLLLGLIVLPNIATGAITYGVFQQMRGKDTSIGDCLARGLSSLLPILGLAIVQGLAIMLGFIACVIPGVLLALRWAVSIPAAVSEGVGVSEAMGRSTFLTDGLRGDIFGVLFVIGFINGGSALLLRLAAARNHELVLLLTCVQQLLTVGLSATASAVMYYRLRSLKESIDVDQIASVFA
jgi:hypothetical protein